MSKKKKKEFFLNILITFVVILHRLSGDSNYGVTVRTHTHVYRNLTSFRRVDKNWSLNPHGYKIVSF